MTRCDAKMRPFADNIELQCEQTQDFTRPHTEHYATLHNYAYLGSKTAIHWMEDDRRTFRGTWAPCSHKGCVLPKTHRGNHAVA